MCVLCRRSLSVPEVLLVHAPLHGTGALKRQVTQCRVHTDAGRASAAHGVPPRARHIWFSVAAAPWTMDITRFTHGRTSVAHCLLLTQTWTWSRHAARAYCMHCLRVLYPSPTRRSILGVRLFVRGTRVHRRCTWHGRLQALRGAIHVAAWSASSLPRSICVPRSPSLSLADRCAQHSWASLDTITLLWPSRLPAELSA